jgi:sulfotransferase family protein
MLALACRTRPQVADIARFVRDSLTIMLGSQLRDPDQKLESEPIRVLFIAGTGRSGSTLLDRLIGQIPGAFAAGELGFLWERGLRDNRLCACSQPFRSCDFWTEVTERAGDGRTPEELGRVLRLWESIDSSRHLPWRYAFGGRRSAKYREYARIVERLYRAVAEVSGCEVIIDSTKNASRGLILADLPGIDLNVVHLVRDSRAVAFSWARRRRDPSIHWKDGEMERYGAVSSSRMWVTHNLTAQFLSSRVEGSLRVRYEDLVDAPRATIQSILRPYEALKNDFDISRRDDPAEMVHTVSGNPMLFDEGPIEIRADEQWKTAIEWKDRSIVTALTWPLLAKYGYPVVPPALP